MKDTGPIASFSIPTGSTVTDKGDGKFCALIEGTMEEGEDGMKTLSVTKVEPYEKEEKPKPKKKGRKQPARISAIMGEESEEEY